MIRDIRRDANGSDLSVGVESLIAHSGLLSWRRMSLHAFLILAAVVGIGFLTTFYAGDDGVEFATSLALWIALSESWIILCGFAGYISLGHAAFVGAGAYAMVLSWGSIPYAAGLALAAFVAGALALVVGTPCLRTRGPYFVILTLGVSEFLKFGVINIEAGLGKFGRLLLDAPDPGMHFYLALGLAAGGFLLAYVVRFSRLGVGLRAIRENETSAEMTGIAVAPLKILAFVLSGIIPGMVGAVMVSRSGYFEPVQIFSPRISLTIITICIAGGSDNPWGPVVGAVFLEVLSEYLSESAPQLYLIILGTVLVGFVLGMPEGLISQWDRVMRDRRARRTRS